MALPLPRVQQLILPSSSVVDRDPLWHLETDYPTVRYQLHHYASTLVLQTCQTLKSAALSKFGNTSGLVFRPVVVGDLGSVSETGSPLRDWDAVRTDLYSLWSIDRRHYTVSLFFYNPATGHMHMCASQLEWDILLPRALQTSTAAIVIPEPRPSNQQPAPESAPIRESHCSRDLFSRPSASSSAGICEPPKKRTFQDSTGAEDGLYTGQIPRIKVQAAGRVHFQLNDPASEQAVDISPTLPRPTPSNGPRTALHARSPIRSVCEAPPPAHTTPRFAPPSNPSTQPARDHVGEDGSVELMARLYRQQPTQVHQGSEGEKMPAFTEKSSADSHASLMIGAQDIPPPQSDGDTHNTKNVFPVEHPKFDIEAGVKGKAVSEHGRPVVIKETPEEKVTVKSEISTEEKNKLEEPTPSNEAADAANSTSAGVTVPNVEEKPQTLGHGKLFAVSTRPQTSSAIFLPKAQLKEEPKIERKEEDKSTPETHHEPSLLGNSGEVKQLGEDQHKPTPVPTAAAPSAFGTSISPFAKFIFGQASSAPSQHSSHNPPPTLLASGVPPSGLGLDSGNPLITAQPLTKEQPAGQSTRPNSSHSLTDFSAKLRDAAASLVSDHSDSAVAASPGDSFHSPGPSGPTKPSAFSNPFVSAKPSDAAKPSAPVTTSDAANRSAPVNSSTSDFQTWAGPPPSGK